MSDGPDPGSVSYVDQQTTAALEKVVKLSKGKQLSELSLHDLRHLIQEIQTPAPKDPNVSVTHFSVSTSHGEVKTFLYQPKHTQSDTLPFVYHLHGGGWVAVNAFDESAFAFDLVARTGCAFVLPQYTLAPEAQYPVQQEQCLEVLQWLVKHGQSKNLLTDRIVISGDSAGGQLAPAVNILNHQRNLHLPIVHQILLHPLVDSTSLISTFSQYLFQKGPFLTSAFVQEVFDDYYGPLPESTEARATILASPILMKPAQAKRFMPSTTVLTAQVDWLRDQGQDFAKLLQQAGVECGVMQAVATIHDGVIFNGVRNSATSDLIKIMVAGKVREVLMPKGEAEEKNRKCVIEGDGEEHALKHGAREAKRKRRS